MIDCLVSVVMPCHNSSRFVSNAIESVLNQTYRRWELIVVDDCSSDDTCDIIKKHISKDDRIKLFRFEKNRGAAEARNKAISVARGRFIAFLDSDDFWEKEKLKKQLNFMMKKNAAFSYTCYNVVRENGEATGKVIDIKAKDCVTYRDMLAKKATLGCSTVIIDRFMVDNLTMPLLRSGQDYATWLIILKKIDGAMILKESLGNYRVVRGSLSSNKFKKSKRQWYIYRKIEGIGFLKSCYYFVSYAIRAFLR